MKVKNGVLPELLFIPRRIEEFGRIYRQIPDPPRIHLWIVALAALDRQLRHDVAHVRSKMRAKPDIVHFRAHLLFEPKWITGFA